MRADWRKIEREIAHALQHRAVSRYIKGKQVPIIDNRTIDFYRDRGDCVMVIVLRMDDDGGTTDSITIDIAALAQEIADLVGQ